jgi:ABC-type antimicrobial peptide transport system permease subunit
MGRNGRIIGVMKNFHFKPVRDAIEPLAFALVPRFASYILIRTGPGDVGSALKSIEATWQRVIPNYPFEYKFLDEDFDEMYRMEARIMSLLKYFAIFAVFIACLGLYGLASFMAEQRTKEVGIRKVLGASMVDIFVLLTRDFTKWVLIANLIAWPAAYFLMRQWLQSFAYRTEMSGLNFVISALMALGIALLTVSYQAIIVGLASPGKALKYE